MPSTALTLASQPTSRLVPGQSNYPSRHGRHGRSPHKQAIVSQWIPLPIKLYTVNTHPPPPGSFLNTLLYSITRWVLRFLRDFWADQKTGAHSTCERSPESPSYVITLDMHKAGETQRKTEFGIWHLSPGFLPTAALLLPVPGNRSGVGSR